MAYSKTNWVNNTTPINETNLNKIEQGIYDNSLVVDAITNTLNPTDTETYKTAELTEGQITDVIGVNDIVIKGQTSQNGEPTPNTPIPVNVVTGDNEIKVEGKNLLHLENGTKTDGGITGIISNDNVLTYSGTATKPYSNCTTEIPFKLPSGTYTFSIDHTTTNNERIVLYLSGGTSQAIVIPGGNTSNTFTLNGTNTTMRVGITSISIGTSYSGTVKMQLEKDSTQTTYEPYQGQTYPINLGSLELCKIGDYQDYFYKSGSKWYLHKEINKITSYNGETITTSYISTTGELSTRAKVYYVVTPTDTKITDTTLISQLEAIYNAPLYEQTNITQTNNDLPMVLDITACKDNIKGIKAFIRK